MNKLHPITLLLLFISYFLGLLFVSYLVGRKSQNNSFYTGDRKSPWFVVAFGMIGTTLSGVTFISVPGEVGNSAFHYLQFVMGNVLGYIIIATLLLPFYYRKNIISIYSVLQEKMGTEGHLTTSGFFLLSKVVGAAFRLYLAALVIHMSIAEPLGISFTSTVLFCLLLIGLYTVKSGIKTIVWSDTIQTIVLLTTVIVTIITIVKQTGLNADYFFNEILQQPNTKIFQFDWYSPNNFFKQFLAGIFITIALNGFDQDIIQKNLTCKNGKKARTNMLVFSMMFIVAVFLFLVLGALLYYYAQSRGLSIPAKSDQLFPSIALNSLGTTITILFVLGISAAAFSSADSANTALTTTFCVDFIQIGKKTIRQQKRIRTLVHFSFSILLFVTIMFFYHLNDESVVVSIFKAAGYTYGPIFGVFFFSFFINRIPNRKLILIICLISPILTYLFTLTIKYLFDGYQFGFELIIINSCITILFLTFFSKQANSVKIV